jgi:Cu/Ag efflux protein CusF
MPPDKTDERNRMKTMRIITAATAATAFLGLASSSPASGTPATAQSQAQCEKVFKGNVTSVDVPDHILSVRSFLFRRNFNTGSDCRVSLQDKANAALGDLRPGQEVSIRYQDENGVLIARNIAQHDLVYSGHITAINPQQGTLLVRHGVVTREFVMPSNPTVVLQDNKAASLNNLQLGDAVNVIYERANGSHVVSRIEQNSSTYAGTIAAIDTATRTLKARDGRGDEKQFSLADHCAIVINGKLNDSMNTLQIGQQATINYNNVDGVLVANRVSPISGATAAAPAPAQTAQQPIGQWHAYNSYNY